MNSTRYKIALRVGAAKPTRDPITREPLVPIACDCKPPVEHGPHWVRGNDKRTKVRRLTAKLAGRA